MRNPGFHPTSVALVCAILVALAATPWAQPPSNAPEVQASKGPRTKPQVIYHVRPVSNYSATLHSQEKTQNNQLPVDADMPLSLQISRSNANAAAAEANARAQQQATPKRHINKRPKFEKQPHRTVRPMPSMKGKGQGKGHKH